VLDFVVASLVSAYFRLINLLFKACFTVLESEQSRFLLGLATSSAKLVLTHNFFHEVSHSIGFITLSGGKIESPGPPILIVGLENLAGKLHCGRVLGISSGIFPLTPSGLNVRNPLVKVGRVKFCRTYEGTVFGNSISDPRVIIFERDSMETKVPKRQPDCHPHR